MKWMEIQLGDVVEFNKKSVKKNTEMETIKYIDISSVGTNILNGVTEMLLKEAPSRAKRIISDKDSIISTVRPGRRSFYYFKQVEENTVASTGFAVLSPKMGKVDSRFLFYLINLHSFTQHLVANEQGATYPAVTPDIISKYKFKIPPLETQHKIASILSAYDDLIENNMRRIKLLEEAARLIYKEWFVRLRFPGHEHIRVVDGVPDGWIKKAMDDVCESVGGGTPSTKVSEYWDNGNIIWITPTDVTKNNCIVLLDSEKKITEEGLKKSSAKLVPPDTILMTSRASIGFFALIDKEVCTNQGFISIIPSEENSRMYLLFNLIHRKEEIISKAGGTTYKEIIKSTFRNFEIMIPSKNILNSFNNYAYNFIRQVRLLKKQNQKLKEARDILLPRLMNGSIQV